MQNTTVRDYRKAKGWTQAQLASRAGLHRVTVSRLERGYVPMWGTALDALALTLDVPRDRLSSGDDRSGT